MSGPCYDCLKVKRLTLYMDNDRRIVYLCRGCARRLGYR